MYTPIKSCIYIYKINQHGSLVEVKVSSFFHLHIPYPQVMHHPVTPRYFAHRPRTIESVPLEPDPLGICQPPHLTYLFVCFFVCFVVFDCWLVCLFACLFVCFVLFCFVLFYYVLLCPVMFCYDLLLLLLLLLLLPVVVATTNSASIGFRW